MARSKLEDESFRKQRVDAFIEKFKIDLIGEKECKKIAKEALEKKYKQIKKK